MTNELVKRGGGLPLGSGGIRLPQTRLSMRKLKEVLRLHSLGLKQQQIGRSCPISQSTVHKYLKAAAAAGVSWPLPLTGTNEKSCLAHRAPLPFGARQRRRISALSGGSCRPTAT